MKEVLASFHWSGDPDEMRSRYDAVLAEVVAVSPAQPLIHLAVQSDDGFRVYDVWTDEDIARKMVDNPEFRAKLEEFGLGHATINVRSVHRMGWPQSMSPMYR